MVYRDLRLILIVISFYGCKGYPIRMEGQFKKMDPTLKSVAVYKDNGVKKELTTGPLKMDILGSETINLSLMGEKGIWAKPWTLRFGSGSLKSFMKEDELLLKASEIDQKYDFKLKKKYKLLGSDEKVMFVDCLYADKKWEKNYRGIATFKDSIIKGHQKALVRVEKYHEIITVEFIDRRRSRLVGVFTGKPREIHKHQTLETYDHCRGD